MDREILNSLITSWNPHFTNPTKGRWIDTIPRKKYLELLKKLVETRQVLTLTGVRRAGKSTLMHQVMNYLITEKGVPPQNILYLFLEDVMAQQYLSLGWKLLDDIYTYYLETYNPQGKVYLFLDEIQSIKDFNRWISVKYEKQEDIKFILSGSRKSLVESDTATLLTGRNLQIDIYPLDFSEYLDANKVDLYKDKDFKSLRLLNNNEQSKILHYLAKYLNEGGYPEIVLSKDETIKKALASNYYRDTITRDVIIPNNLRSQQEVEILGLQVLSDFTKTHTYSSLSKPQKLSVDTTKLYLNYFEKAYLFFESKYFSYKTKETQDIQKPRKIYIVDNGLRNFNIPLLRPDLGQCAENVVYMELKRKNPAIYYWKSKREIDFITLNPNLSLYNVTYTNEPHKREIDSMIEGLNEFDVKKGTILTKNYFNTIKIDNKSIDFIPLWMWLLSHS